MPANIRRIYSISGNRNFQYRGVQLPSPPAGRFLELLNISDRKSILRQNYLLREIRFLITLKAKALKTSQDWASLHDNLSLFNGKRIWKILRPGNPLRLFVKRSPGFDWNVPKHHIGPYWKFEHSWHLALMLEYLNYPQRLHKYRKRIFSMFLALG